MPWKILLPELLFLATTTLGLSQGQPLVVSPASLTFNVLDGEATPPPQYIDLKSTTSPIEVSFNVAVAIGTTWLSVSPSAGQTPATLVVSAHPNAMATGTYNSTITISPKNGTATVVPVALTIGMPILTVSPPQITFVYHDGGPIKQSQSLQVSGTSGVAFGVTAATSSGGNWLSVNPKVGTTPAPITVTTDAGAPVGSTFHGTITIGSATGNVSASVAVPVILTGVAPPPTITAVANAASFLNHAISPGEVVSVFGTAIGPAAAQSLQLDSTGKVSTSLAGVQVLFSGHPAPLTYVSTTQINCVVPYEIVGISNPSVQVTYSGQTSNVMGLTSALASPGIFATNGTGQAAVLNQDGSVNGPTHPEAAGNIVSVFMTGEGQTSPPESRAVSRARVAVTRCSKSRCRSRQSRRQLATSPPP